MLEISIDELLANYFIHPIFRKIMKYENPPFATWINKIESDVKNVYEFQSMFRFKYIQLDLHF